MSPTVGRVSSYPDGLEIVDSLPSHGLLFPENTQPTVVDTL